MSKYTDESDIKPKGKAVNCSRTEHVELKRDLNSVKVGLMCSLEVDHVSLSLGGADVDVECVYNGLAEILVHRRVTKRGEVDSVEIFLVPKVNLVKLFHVQGFISEGCNVEISPAGEHSAPGFQKLLCVQERLQHPLVEQHVAHRLGYDYVHQLGRVHGDAGCLHGVNPLGASLLGEERENAR